MNEEPWDCATDGHYWTWSGRDPSLPWLCVECGLEEEGEGDGPPPLLPPAP